jgi:hypothetical protein
LTRAQDWAFGFIKYMYVIASFHSGTTLPNLWSTARTAMSLD